ncbi:Amidohydrolase 2 [Penicillium malachiteum]|uniref:Amidohydrolase 2 n=1 Tax=Penicillium malachiteum TaxID=1324776 RepID=UPI0025489612|nr:Amidohydrolase 2 [Penicillium malachiteum]KAJ5720229.1 Amidohydrolase 2 [Penicillium malachiteum]
MLTSAQPPSKILGVSPRLSLTAISSPRIEQRLSHTPAGSTLPLKYRLPLQSWDSHMHVVEPQQFPVSKAAVYQPSVHTLADALAFESTLGLENLVFVQPSIYGTDNSCLLAALAKLGPSRGRGVVVVDPASIQSETLEEWHNLGVRGLRVNLQSVGKVMEESELEETLLRHADIARPRNWIVEVYLPLKMMPMLESIAPRLGVTLCIDHFGSPDLSSLPENQEGIPFDPYTLPGFQSLTSLLRTGNNYIKISAPYRLTNDRTQSQLKAMAHEFLTAAPDRVIYATDWPHTRFTNIDISPFTEWCLDLCANVPGMAEKLFRRNTERMLDVNSPSS